MLVRTFIGEEYLSMGIDEHDGGNLLPDNFVEVDPKVNFLHLSMELWEKDRASELVPAEHWLASHHKWRLDVVDGRVH